MRFFQKSFLTRLSVYFFLLSVIIILLLGESIYYFLIKETKKAVLENIETLAATMEEDLNRWVDDQKREIIYYSELPEIRTLVETLVNAKEKDRKFLAAYSDLEERVRLILNHHPEFLEFSILAQQGGRVVFSTDRDSEGTYKVLDTYFIEGKKGVYIQNVYPSPVSLRPTMIISAPIYGSNRKLFGVLAVNLSLKRMDEIIRKRAGLGKSGEAYLVDRYNIFVSGRRFGRDDFLRGVHSVGIDAAINGENGSGAYANYRGVTVIGAYRWIKQRDLALLLEIPKREAFKSVRKQTVLIVSIGLFMFALLAIGVYLLARRIVKPISAVQQAAQRVSTGDLDIQVPVLTQDEIGNLAGSFNRMTIRLKLLYDEIRNREEHFRSLIEGSTDIVAILDREGVVTYISPSVEKILGYRPDELVGKIAFSFLHPEGLSTIKENFQELIDGRALIPNCIVEYLHKDGSWHSIEASGRNMLDNPSVHGIVINARDITEKKELEEQFFQAQKMEAVGKLAGGIAHDFNNLLTAIIGYSELLLMGQNVDANARESIEEIKKSADRAASLTQQLLAYSRKQLLMPRIIDLNQLLLNTRGMLQRLIREDVELITELDNGLKPVKADPGKIEQVIMNLVVNSRDAMPDGGRLSIETKNVLLDESYCSIYPEITPGPYVLTTVSDTGEGMNEAVKEKIFEPFFTTKEVGKGTGLGLSTVYGIIKQSGGHISVHSDINRGTTFKIYLPASESTVGEAEEGAEAAEMQHGHESILVVEDEQYVRKYISRILEDIGHHVYEAESPVAALKIMEQLDKKEVTMLITDVVMPAMNGRELAEKLLELNKKMKVLFISGYTGDAIMDRGVLPEGVSFLQKPFSPTALSRKVREMIDGHKESA